MIADLLEKAKRMTQPMYPEQKAIALRDLCDAIAAVEAKWKACPSASCVGNEEMSEHEWRARWKKNEPYCPKCGMPLGGEE